MLTFISVTWVNFNQERWIKKDVITHDIINYYGYLPAFFLEKDLSLSFLNDTINTKIEDSYYWPNKTPAGKPVFKMSMGMAVTYLPFFAMAHLFATLFDYPTNGFSEPYHFAVLFSSLFYILIGLYFLSKVLKLFFSEAITTIVLLCLSFGTNVFFYLTIGGGLAHTMGFTLIAIFLYYAILWHRQPTLQRALWIGCLGGLLTLIRPINILIFVFFFLYDIKSLKDISIKIKFLLLHTFHLLLMASCGVLIFLPQLFYWKYVSGVYFFNSYVGEHFFFNNPHIFYGLFSFRKGWLVYTPIMFFALFGFYFLRDKLKPFLVAMLCFFSIYVYVAFSWWCWWYGGSFGSRVLIDTYPLLAIPFAAFLTKIKSLSYTKKQVVYVMIVCLIGLNLFQSIQAKYNIIHYDSMTRASYVEVFFTITKKPDREKYLQHPDLNKALKGEDEY